MPYQTAVQGWHDFFIIAGTAAATLVGLLFVGLSLHLRAVLARSEVRALARVTLSSFALVLVVSLFIVVPEGAQSTGEALIWSGVVSIALMLRPLVSAALSASRTFRVRLLALRFLSTLVAYAGTIVGGVLLINGAYGVAFNDLLGVTLMLLLLSMRNTWDLLVTVAEASLGHTDGSASSSPAPVTESSRDAQPAAALTGSGSGGSTNPTSNTSARLRSRE